MPVLPDPVLGLWSPPPPLLVLGAVVLTPAPLAGVWRAVTPARVTLNKARPAPLALVLTPVTPQVLLQLPEAPIASAVLSALAEQYVKADVLVEAASVGLKLSWEYEPDSTWEHRLLQVGDIELGVPPGGGLATVAQLTVQVAEGDGTGQSLRNLWNTYSALEGADITVRLLPDGSSYGAAVRVFSGRIDRVRWRDNVATLTAADESLPQNLLLPTSVVTSQAYPALSPRAAAQAGPIVFGAGSAVSLAPLLLVDTGSTRAYLAADSPLRQLSSTPTLGAFNEAANAVRTLIDTTSTVVGSAGSATVRVSGSPVALKFGASTATLAVLRQQTVSVAAYAHDGDPTTRATIGTTTTNSAGEGEGYLGLVASFGAPVGGNYLTVSLAQHKRGALAAATVTGQFSVRAVDSGGTVRRDAIKTTPEFRHATQARDTTLTVSPVTLGSGERVEVLCTALQESGAGSAGAVYEWGDLTVQLWYQPWGDEEPLYLVSDWQGRQDTAAGAYTGTASALITNPIDVLRNLLVAEIGVPVNAANFNAARTWRTLWKFAGGLGAGWAMPRVEARQLCALLARSAFCVLAPDGQGTWSVVPIDATTSVHDFTLDNILAREASGTPPPGSMEVWPEPLEMVHNRYELFYAYHAGRHKYDKMRFANRSTSNAQPQAVADRLVANCSTSFTRYGSELTPLRLELPFVYDDATADLLLEELVNTFYSQRVRCTFDTTFGALHLRLGDRVTVTHPLLPTADTGQLFEVLGLRYQVATGRITVTARRVAAS